MGYTFAAALVKKTGTAPATRKAIREGLERMGYTKAASAEDASLCLPLHHDKKSAWLTIALEIPERLNAQLELLRRLSAEMHTPILYFMNFDSDFLYVAATDGAAVQHVHVGFIDEDDDDPENAECMQDSEDLSVFDALRPDDAARAEFRRILAVDEEERVFSEEAAQEMAALFGYTPEALFIDEDAEPFAVLGFDLPGREAVPFLMPEDAPPAFTTGMCNYGFTAEVYQANPLSLDVDTCGGAGKGVRVVMAAEGYDAEDWQAGCAILTNRNNRLMGHPAPVEYEAKAMPERISFSDGSKGWKVEFPDAPVLCGLNRGRPETYSDRGVALSTARSYSLRLLFTGGTFPEGKADPSEKTHIWVIPMENPKGWVHFVALRQEAGPLPPWYEPDDK